MPKRILLADDSITIQKVVELTFSDGDYEVTAVNNGAKAIQKLGEMRPDIILSDIIMPEKNGYEVCEYVKSNPDYRNIPVVLLTGTFEPFDPDRAEKAGCDAVVTKPFESQSLIHKVEELIANAQSAAPAAAAAPASPEPVAVDAPSPWMDDEPAAPVELPPQTPSPFTTSSGRFPTADSEFTHDSDIFGAAPAPLATTEMPFDTSAETPFGGGETRAFPRMSFDDFGQTPPPPPPAAEPSPWDEQDFGGETRAFGKVSLDDLQSMQQPLDDASSAPPPPPPPAQFVAEPEPESPFGAPPHEEELSSETRAFERVSFDELQQQMSQPAPEPPAYEPEPEPEPEAAPVPVETSPWDEPAETPLFGGASYEAPAPERQDPQPEPQAETSPWDDQPAFGGETRAFPKMSFDDLAAMAPTPEPQAAEPEPSPEPAPWEEPAEPAWSPDAVADAPAETESFATAAYTPFTPETSPAGSELPPSEQPMIEELPFAASTTGEPELEALPAPSPSDEEPLPIVPAPAEEPEWSPSPAAEAAAEPQEPVVPPPALAPESPALPIRSSDLSDEQIDKIARRVVELMSEQVVRNIAWEVIPDLAEMVVKERIRQLESEA